MEAKVTSTRPIFEPRGAVFAQVRPEDCLARPGISQSRCAQKEGASFKAASGVGSMELRAGSFENAEQRNDSLPPDDPLCLPADGTWVAQMGCEMAGRVPGVWEIGKRMADACAMASRRATPSPSVDASAATS